MRYEFDKSIYNSMEKLKKGKFRLEIGAVADNSQNMLVSRKETFPHLWAIKQTNIRTEDQSKFNPHISPIGYLWYGAEDSNKNKVMFSSGKPDNDMVEIFTWNTQISYKGRGPSFYSAYITRNGDIICVYKGHRETESENARQNPIVYPAGDYDNPVEVELDIKPTAWLQNSGADYIFPGTRNFFMFAEYTRPIHDKCRVWKVKPPFTNPSDWEIVMELDVTPGLEHFHTVSFDPYSSRIYVTTGDDDDNCKVYESSNNGSTWNIVLEGNEAKARLLNFVFTENGAYWASDARTQHQLNFVSRKSDKTLDFDTFEKICDLPDTQATYTTCLLNRPKGLLFLDRFDTINDPGPLLVTFWSFEDNKLYVIDEIDRLKNITWYKEYGFRCEAASFYQSEFDDRIMVGFNEQYPNDMNVANNYRETSDTKWNLSLKVVRNI